MHDFIGLMLASLALALATALIYRVLTKPDAMRRIKAEIKELQQKSSKAQKSGDQKEASRLISEMMKRNNDMFRMNMKPMIASAILFFAAYYGWLLPTFSEVVISTPFYVPILGNDLGMLGWYFIVVVAGNIFFRKLLGVE